VNFAVVENLQNVETENQLLRFHFDHPFFETSRDHFWRGDVVRCEISMPQRIRNVNSSGQKTRHFDSSQTNWIWHLNAVSN